MNNYSYPPHDNWEYGTGRTEPPKSRGGIIALLLILVIFLTGIIAVLGILNIRLFRRLSAVTPREPALSFTAEESATLPAAQAQEEPISGPYEEPRSDISIDLQGEMPDSTPGEGVLSLQDIYKQNIPAVVSISCTLPGGSASGTGVILDPAGYIVTNAHVVEGAQTVTVRLTDDREFPADILGCDTVSDLAVLYIDAPGLTAARLGNSDDLEVGDAVVAIGDPLGIELRGTMTDGIISAINRDVTIEGRTMSLLQTNAALNAGNSGGPLINRYGQVIGINTMKIGDFMSRSGVEGLGFAIPSRTVKEIVDQLIAQGYVSGRPTIGLQGEPLSLFYQHYYGLPAGMYLTEVDRTGPAGRAGIEAGDILVAVNGTAITSMNDLNTLLYAREVGDSITLLIYRSGQQGEVTIKIAEAKK